MKKLYILILIAFTTLLYNASIFANPEEIRELKRRVSELEAKQSKKQAVEQTPQGQKKPGNFALRNIFSNDFNPAIGVILNGTYRYFSSKEGEIAGFAVGEEGERRTEGISIDHSELNFSANADDKFSGNLTAAIVEHHGAMEIELEEAYLQILPGALPFTFLQGLNLKGGRAFWTLGYLNEHHSHVDDFADRPLPYRVFLDNAFNDDGLEISYILPIDVYTEIGGGIFRGADFPFSNENNANIPVGSAFLRLGSDIGSNHSWRIGGYALIGESTSQRSSNEGQVLFEGDAELFIADFRYTWAPTGNAHEHEITLQAEYFWRQERGNYQVTAGESHEHEGEESEEEGAGDLSDPVKFNNDTSGWYAQIVYKFHQQWRIGFRYSQLLGPESIPNDLTETVLDTHGHQPVTYSVMIDWSNSEFSRLRFQYNREETAHGQSDDQFIVQYIISLGAHAAHKY